MKYRLIFILLIILCGTAAADGINREPYSFEEAAELFQALPYLQAAETGDNVDFEALEYLLLTASEDSGLISLFIRSFFRETENEDIRSFVLSLIEEKGLNSAYHQVLKNRYTLDKKPLPVEGGEQDFFRNEADTLRDENLYFSDLTELNPFDSEIVLYAPLSSWSVMQFQDQNTGISDDDTVLYMAGGGTTAMSVTCKRISIPAGRKGEGKDGDIPATGVIEQNLFDSSSLSISDSDSQIFLNFQFYSSEYGALYQITYYYNISSLNVNYPIYSELKQQLLYIGYLTYCNL